MADRLREHEHVVAARAGQIVVARQGEDRRAWRVDLDVVDKRSGAAIGIGHGDIECHRTCISVGGRDCQSAWIVRLYGPSAVTVVGALAQGPAGRDTAEDDGGRANCKAGKTQINWLAGNAGRRSSTKYEVAGCEGSCIGKMNFE